MVNVACGARQCLFWCVVSRVLSMEVAVLLSMFALEGKRMI